MPSQNLTPYEQWLANNPKPAPDYSFSNPNSLDLFFSGQPYYSYGGFGPKYTAEGWARLKAWEAASQAAGAGNPSQNWYNFQGSSWASTPQKQGDVPGFTGTYADLQKFIHPTGDTTSPPATTSPKVAIPKFVTPYARTTGVGAFGEKDVF